VLVVSPALAVETITLPQVTADISFSKDYGGVTAGSSLTISLELPCALESLNNTNNNITVTADDATASTTVNLTVNGVAVATNYDITGGSSKTWTFVDFANAGVNMSVTYLTIVVEAVANATTATVLNLSGDDIALVDNYTTSYSEVFLTKPEVMHSRTLSFFTAKDVISITQDSDINLTDVKCSLTYPDHAISKPVTSINFESLNKSESKSVTVIYQKWGPYVSDFDKEVSDDEITITIIIYSFENITASYEFNTTEEPYVDYFTEFSKDNIKDVELNGVDVDWEDPSGVIKIDSLSLKEGLNELNVTYTKVAVAATPTYPTVYGEIVVEEVEWYEQTFLGIPVYIWVAIIIGLTVYAVIRVATRR